MSLAENKMEHKKLKFCRKNKKELNRKYGLSIVNKPQQGWLGPAIKDATSSMIASQTERVDDTIGLMNQLGYSVIQGIGIAMGVELLSKLWREEKIKYLVIMKKAIFLGIDFGVKTLGVWFLKKLVESGMILLIPSTAEAGTISNISYIIIENIKILGFLIIGKLKLSTCFKSMEMTTLEIILGIAISDRGVEIGYHIGREFGYIFAGAFGFLGGTIGYILGFKAAEIILSIIDNLYMKEKKIRTSIVKELIDVMKNIIRELKIIF